MRNKTRGITFVPTLTLHLSAVMLGLWTVILGVGVEVKGSLYGCLSACHQRCYTNCIAIKNGDGEENADTCHLKPYRVIQINLHLHVYSDQNGTHSTRTWNQVQKFSSVMATKAATYLLMINPEFSKHILALLDQLDVGKFAILWSKQLCQRLGHVQLNRFGNVVIRILWYQG